MEPVGFWIYFSRINMIYAVKQDKSKGEFGLLAQLA